MPSPSCEPYSRAMGEPTLGDLPPALQQPILLSHRKFLMGPGQQDMLLDVLWSTLYGRRIRIRKAQLAQHAIDGFPRYERKAKQNRMILESRSALLPLNVCHSLSGIVVRTPRLVALMALPQSELDPFGLVRAAYNPCAKCFSQWAFRKYVHALHCQGKSPKCFDPRQCTLSSHLRRWR